MSLALLVLSAAAWAGTPSLGVIERVEGERVDGHGAGSNDVVRAALPALEACQGPLPIGERPAGPLKLQIDLDATGKVTAVEAVGDVGALAPVLTCITDVTRALAFPASAGRLVVPLGFDVPAPPPKTTVAAPATAAVPRPRIDLLDVTAIGKLTSEQIKGPLIMDKHRLTPCYKDRVAQDANLAGQVTLNLTILAGKAQTIVVGSTTLQDPQTEQCLTTVLGTLTFPNERKPTEATVGLDLKSAP
jgi:hypothetical protein